MKIDLCEKNWPPVWIHNPGPLVLSLSIELGRAGEARHHHVIRGVLRQPVLNITLPLSLQTISGMNGKIAKKGTMLKKNGVVTWLLFSNTGLCPPTPSIFKK
jgi:hypothetical protein